MLPDNSMQTSTKGHLPPYLTIVIMYPIRIITCKLQIINIIVNNITLFNFICYNSIYNL
jgi:hypothetical protein